MAIIYFKRYKAKIDKGQITVEEAIADAEHNVPERWREEVIAMLGEINGGSL